MKFRNLLNRSAVGLLLSVAATNQSAYAQDLMELWEIALVEDSKYLSAKHQFLANQEGIIQTRAQLLPTLSLKYEEKSTDQGINRSDNTVFASGNDKYDTTTTGITLTQSLFDYSRWQRYAQSKINHNKAEVEFELARQQLVMRLAEGYFLVLERADQLNTVLSEKAAMGKHLIYSERKLESGLGRRVDVEEARARYLNSLSKEFDLQSRLMDSRFALREIIGSLPGKLSDLNPEIELKSPLPAKPEDWINMSAKHNLELRVMNLTLDVAQKEVRALRADHYPTLDLVYTDNNVDTDGSLFGGGSDIDSADLVLQLNIPLYAGGATQSKVRQAAEKRYSVIEDLTDKRRNVERSAQDAFNRIQTAIVQIGALSQSVKAQDRLLQTKSAGYRTGKYSILEVLDAQQDLSQAHLALTKARYDYVLNILRLKSNAGDLQVEDLAAVNDWLTVIKPDQATGE